MSDIAPTFDAAPDYRSIEPAPKLPRIWPPVVLVAILWIFNVVTGQMELTMFEKFGARFVVGAAVLLLFLLWWLFASRVSWRERSIVLLGFIAVNILASLAAHPSLHGIAWEFFVVPVVLTAWAIVWGALARRLSPARRLVALSAAIVLPCAVCALLRMDGITGEQHLNLSWRWSPTREQLYLAALARTQGAPAARPATTQSDTALASALVDWPGFRGPGRDGVAGGLTIATDWSANPPRLLWHQPIGPGWSSPIVVGQRVFTQEQRGGNEVTVCRDADAGVELWIHQDPVRFEEGMSGAGPRATPTFANGNLFTLGATGILNRLDASTGRAIWSRDITAGSAVKPPMWGFASSPAGDRRRRDRLRRGHKGRAGIPRGHLRAGVVPRVRRPNLHLAAVSNPRRTTPSAFPE